MWRYTVAVVIGLLFWAMDVVLVAEVPRRRAREERRRVDQLLEIDHPADARGPALGGGGFEVDFLAPDRTRDDLHGSFIVVSPGSDTDS